MMWLFFLGWIAGVVACIGFGKWLSNRGVKEEYKLTSEEFEAMQKWVKEHDERSERDP